MTATPPCIIVGIAGGSGSGKTTLARALYAKLGGCDNPSVLHLVHDFYYKDQSYKPLEDRAKTNFDHPDALETNLLIRHIRELKAGKNVDVPSYDFATHTRISDKPLEVIQSTEVPIKIIILEGILVLAHEDLMKEMDIKVYVDADADIRLIRRLARDVAERGRNMEDVMHQYQDTVRPMHDTFVEPSKKEADMIVYSEGHSMDVAIEMLLNHLKVKSGMI